MNLRKLSLLLFFLLCQKLIFCQYLSPVSEAIMIDFYQFSFYYNDDDIENLVNRNEIPEEEGLFLQMNYYWWNYLMSNEPEQISDFINKLDDKDNDVFSNNDNSKMLGVGTHMLAARYHVANKNKYKSLFSMKRAFFLYTKMKHKQSEEYGFVNCIIESVIQYSMFSEIIIIPYIKSFFNPDHAKDINLFTHSDNKLLKTEATYFLAKKSLKLDKDYNSSLCYYKVLLTEYPQNIIYRLDYIRALDALNETEEIGKQKDIIRQLCNHNKNLTREHQNHFISQISSN